MLSFNVAAQRCGVQRLQVAATAPDKGCIHQRDNKVILESFPTYHNAAIDAAILRRAAPSGCFSHPNQDFADMEQTKRKTPTTMLPLMRPSCVAACSALRLLPPPETKTASLAGGRAAPVCGSGTLVAAAAASSPAAAAHSTLQRFGARAAAIGVWRLPLLRRDVLQPAAWSAQLVAPAAAAPRMRWVSRGS